MSSKNVGQLAKPGNLCYPYHAFGIVNTTTMQYVIIINRMSYLVII